MSYSRFNSEDIVLSSDAVSVPIWTGNLETIQGSQLTTSSIQKIGLSSNYYLDIYNKSEGQADKAQFAIAYADMKGSGSINYNVASETDGMSPSRTTYGQYRSLVLGDEESNFYFGETKDVVSEYFWAISIDRARYKESLLPGGLQIVLKNPDTQSNVITLIDGGQRNEAVRYIDSGRVYNIYNSASTADTGSYGYFLPDIGTILLDCRMLKSYASASRFSSAMESSSVRPSEPYIHNANVLLKSIDSFTLKEQETVTSNYVFVRAKNSEFNYSINPSNISSTGELVHKIMINQPETYITSVGLYNDANELLAVAKLSRPLPKNFNKEALIRIKLDY